MASMNNPVRRFLWLLLLASAGAAAWTWWRRDRGADDAPNETPTWPPLADAGPAEPAIAAAPPAETAPDAGLAETAEPAIAAAPPAETATDAGLADTAGAATTATPDAEPTSPAWRPPNEDGSCPDGYPVKANDNSGIFHVPSGRFYARTKAERCYATVEAALADGYRQAKS